MSDDRRREIDDYVDNQAGPSMGSVLREIDHLSRAQDAHERKTESALSELKENAREHDRRNSDDFRALNSKIDAKFTQILYAVIITLMGIAAFFLKDQF